MSTTSDTTSATATVLRQMSLRERLRRWSSDRVRQRQMRTRVAAQTAPASPVARVALLAGLAVVAAVNFSLSFEGLYDFGRRLSQLHPILASFVPIGIEGFTLCTIGAIYILRHAPLRIRMFCWTVFVVPVALSVAGNVSHATTRGLHSVAVVASAFWPILLTLATHLVVVTVRYTERVVYESSQMSYDSDKGPSRVVASSSNTTDGTTKRNVAKPSRDAPVRQVSASEDKQYATRRAQEGATVSDIHMELVANGCDINKRTVERWTQHIRKEQYGEKV